MNVLGLVGSPRKGSNTDLLVSAVLEGQPRMGTLQANCICKVDVSSCVDCRVCKIGLHKCAIKDGLLMLYPKLEDADAMVFGTPLYWY